MTAHKHTVEKWDSLGVDEGIYIYPSIHPPWYLKFIWKYIFIFFLFLYLNCFKEMMFWESIRCTYIQIGEKRAAFSLCGAEQRWKPEDCQPVSTKHWSESRAACGTITAEQPKIHRRYTVHERLKRRLPVLIQPRWSHQRARQSKWSNFTAWTARRQNLFVLFFFLLLLCLVFLETAQSHTNDYFSTGTRPSGRSTEFQPELRQHAVCQSRLWYLAQWGEWGCGGGGGGGLKVGRAEFNPPFLPLPVRNLLEPIRELKAEGLRYLRSALEVNCWLVCLFSEGITVWNQSWRQGMNSVEGLQEIKAADGGGWGEAIWRRRER